MNKKNDKNLGIKVPITRNDSTQEGTTIHRKRRFNGTLLGTKSTNPILDTRVCEVEFLVETRYDLVTNIMVEILFDSASNDRYHHIFRLCSEY